MRRSWYRSLSINLPVVLSLSLSFFLLKVFLFLFLFCFSYLLFSLLLLFLLDGRGRGIFDAKNWWRFEEVKRSQSFRWRNVNTVEETQELAKKKENNLKEGREEEEKRFSQEGRDRVTPVSKLIRSEDYVWLLDIIDGTGWIWWTTEQECTIRKRWYTINVERGSSIPSNFYIVGKAERSTKMKLRVKMRWRRDE